MRILLDTNVILDIALERPPFYVAAATILEASDFDSIHLYITASSATDLFYVLRKEKGHDIGFAFIEGLLHCVDVCNVDKSILLAALACDFRDFEDAVQNAAAMACQIEMIVTRDRAGYRTSSISVLSPEDFVAHHCP